MLLFVVDPEETSRRMLRRRLSVGSGPVWAFASIPAALIACHTARPAGLFVALEALKTTADVRRFRELPAPVALVVGANAPDTALLSHRAPVLVTVHREDVDAQLAEEHFGRRTTDHPA